MIQGRGVLLIAISTVLSVALAVAVNVATGGSLPGPLGRLQWLAWPLVALLAAAVVVVGVWQRPRSDPAHRTSAPGALVRPAELPPDVARSQAGTRTFLLCWPQSRDTQDQGSAPR